MNLEDMVLKKPDTKDHSYDSASGTGAPGVVTFTETGGSEATRGRRRGAGSITVQRGGGGGGSVGRKGTFQK